MTKEGLAVSVREYKGRPITKAIIVLGGVGNQSYEMLCDLNASGFRAFWSCTFHWSAALHDHGFQTWAKAGVVYVGVQTQDISRDDMKLRAQNYGVKLVFVDPPADGKIDKATIDSWAEALEIS